MSAKNTVALAIGLALFAAIGYQIRRARVGVAMAAQTPTKRVLFTADRDRLTFVPGHSLPEREESQVFAVRADGSFVELYKRRDPQGGQKVYYISKITDITAKKQSVLIPFGESVLTYPMRSETASTYTQPSQCNGEPAGEMLGYSVVKSVSENGPELTGPNLDKLVITEWNSTRLNCFAMRREAVFYKNGTEIQKTVDMTVNVIEGEPDASLFTVPVSYVERRPSAAMAEARRLFPTFGCSKCNPLPKDLVYDQAKENEKSPN